jgi:hypothetical protein
MIAGRALVTVSNSWMDLGFESLLGDTQGRGTGEFVILRVLVLESGDSHGLFVQSTSTDETAAKCKIFIPWKYVEGILWNEDFEEIETRMGFPASK